MIKRLKVKFRFDPSHEIKVGEMLSADRGAIFFQFDESFPRQKISISPFKMLNSPSAQRVEEKDMRVFDGLFGVFADSLPDGWGLMMMSRSMRSIGKDFAATSPLEKLSYMGDSSMGAFIYEPITEGIIETSNAVELAELAAESRAVLEGKTTDVLPALMKMGGSPGGARPKILVGLESSAEKKVLIAGSCDLPPGFEHWLIKFSGKGESEESGIIEYLYAETARRAKITIPETKLFQDSSGSKWFGVKRFDRGPANTRFHMHSLAGLLHADFRIPSLDYFDVLRATMSLTRRHDDLLAAFRLAVFNVVFHNRDDHAKNFAFVMSRDGQWRLSPAFDLTYSTGPGGEHATSIMGEGKNPTSEHLKKLALKVGIEKGTAREIIEEIEDSRSYLADLLHQYGVRDHPLKGFSSR